ncbi:MAG: hypothetical protein D6742_04750 [Cyanobacteria bacterium J069]|nr:MAG: hypothetical protein D6742_04750 [Cyanobacteria bacterium J069]
MLEVDLLVRSLPILRFTPHPLAGAVISILDQGRTYAVEACFIDLWMIFCGRSPRKIIQLRKSYKDFLAIGNQECAAGCASASFSQHKDGPRQHLQPASLPIYVAKTVTLRCFQNIPCYCANWVKLGIAAV